MHVRAVGAPRDEVVERRRRRVLAVDVDDERVLRLLLEGPDEPLDLVRQRA